MIDLVRRLWGLERALQEGECCAFLRLLYSAGVILRVSSVERVLSKVSIDTPALLWYT